MLLGPHRPGIEAYLSGFGDKVQRLEEPVGLADLEGVERIVSYGYRHMIPPDIVEHFRGRAVNLHVSLLPWNRGADPNLWSFLEDTPKGVTVHLINDGLDTGPIVAQREVEVLPDDTLATSYARLGDAMEALFREVWPAVRRGGVVASIQPPGGSFHRAADRVPFEGLLTKGWQTPVADLVGRAVGRG